VRGETEAYGKLLAKINIVQKQFSGEQLEQIRKIFEAGREED